MAISLSDLQRVLSEPRDLPAIADSYYDREADVLYVTFERGPSDRSDFTPNNVVLRYKDGRLISVTILNASKRPGLHLDSL